MTSQYSAPVDPIEKKKRRREWGTVILLGLVFLLLTWIEFRLFEQSQSLPFVHSIFFFGLVNFNIILFLLLIFLIFRNIVKVFSEQQGGIAGSSLKAKLIAAFVGFSFVPTALMFLVSVFYINNSFDKWFSEKMSSVLKSSLEVNNTYYLNSKKRNYHFAAAVAQAIKSTADVPGLQGKLEKLRKHYSLDSIEYYPGMFDDRVLALTKEVSIPAVPIVNMEFRQKGVVQKAESSTIHHFAGGNLIRVIVPAATKLRPNGAVVVSSFVPLSLISKTDDIAAAYEELRDANPLAYPLKSIYLVILVLMTLVILLGATWFGFYLAKQLSIPLELLVRATRRVSKGDYARVDVASGSPEMSQLIRSFNTMSSDLELSEHEVKQASAELRSTMAQLDEHSRYIEVVLSNVTTGVVSVDERGMVTMVNRHAAELLGIEPKEYVGMPARDVLTPGHFRVFDELLETMKQHKVTSIRKEVRVNVRDQQVPLQMTLSVLSDENGKALGKVIVFDDLTAVQSAQRAAAWTEVARRIAHEIKNPLTPISLAAQRLERKFGEEVKDPAFSECTHMIINQVDDLKYLVNEFSQFARMPESKPTLSCLNKVIEDSLVMFRQAHKGIDFELAVDEVLPDFLFDPEQIKRAITNLVDNAVAAVAEMANGKVFVQTEYDNLLKIVRVSVTDNGRGIPRGLQDRAFEPYVTTKKAGTGLGLAIVKRSVEDHNGFIRAFPNEGGGTKIVIELPVVVADSSSRLLSPKSLDKGPSA